jgi:hypothetical protein
VKEKFLFHELLTTAACGEDVFRILQNFVIDKYLEWTKLIYMCIDEASLMMGNHSRFKAYIKLVALHAAFTQRVFHRYTMAVKTHTPNLCTC